MANQPPIVDLQTQVDFTGVAELDATELNLALSSLAGQVAGDGIAAIGFNLYTIDTAAGIPNVPNPGNAGAGKWIKYQWNRIPFAGSADKTAISYEWNPDQPSDATLLRWVTTRTNVSALQVQVDNNTINIASAVITANQASADAGNALAQAANANANATIAINNSATATATATQASTDAATATAAATAATTTATGAATNAATAITTATAANTAVQQVLPSLAGAWAQFTWNGANIVLNAKYNIASVTRNSQGNYTVVFTTAFSSATNMVLVGSAKNGNDTTAAAIVGTSHVDTGVVTQKIIFCWAPLTGPVDPTEVHILVFGPLIS